MNKVLKIIFKTINFVPLIFFFVPIFSYLNENISILSLFYNDDFNAANLVFLIPFLITLTVGVLSFVLKEDKKTNIIYFLLQIISLSLFSLTTAFYEIINAIDFGECLTLISFYFLIGFSIINLVIQASSLLSEVKLNIRDIVEIGIFVSLAIVLDITGFKIRLHKGGGSISFIMIPLFILCLRQGFAKGFIATGIVFGLISCLYDGYGFHTYPFDYFLGFGVISFIGLFKEIILPNNSNQFKIKGLIFLIVCTVIPCLLRLVSSSISGAIFYGVTFIEALIINAPDILLSTLITVVALALLYKPLLIINKIYPSRD